MAVKEEVFNSIVEYVKNELKLRCQEFNMEPVIPTRSLNSAVIPYERWLVQYTNKKKPKKKVEIPEDYKVAWKKFWNTWPTTKSVPDNKGGWLYRSSSPMKSDENGMFKKWLKVVGKECTIQQMQRAAECYLLYGYNESIIRKENKMIYKAGMGPWLNQQMWKIYMELEMPEQVQGKKGIDTIDI